MKEDLITYKTALLAKEKGFDEITEFWWEIGSGDINDGNKTPCLYSSPGNSLQNSTLMKEYKYQDIRCGEFSAPTQALLQKWLREKHKIHVQPQKFFHNKGFKIGKILISESSYNGPHGGKFDNYEEALEYGLKEALKLI